MILDHLSGPRVLTKAFIGERRRQESPKWRDAMWERLNGPLLVLDMEVVQDSADTLISDQWDPRWASDLQNC